MSGHPATGHNHVTARFHRRFYQGIGLLVLWLVISVWLFFDRGPYMNLTVVVITGFFFILTAIPFLIWQTWHRRAETDQAETNRQVSFRDWSHWDIETWTGRLSGREAAMQALLPIAAVAIGMSIFGLVLAFTLPSLGYQ